MSERDSLYIKSLENKIGMDLKNDLYHSRTAIIST